MKKLRTDLLTSPGCELPCSWLFVDETCHYCHLFGRRKWIGDASRFDDGYDSAQADVIRLLVLASAAALESAAGDMKESQSLLHLTV